MGDVTMHRDKMSKFELYQELLKGCNMERRKLLKTTFADNVIPVREWPRKQMSIFLGNHVSWGDRCSFVYFCMVNGIAPYHIALWARAQPGWLRDAEAWKHMEGLIVSWRDGTFEKQGKMAWNMAGHQVELCYTPTFANELIGRPALDHKPGASFWQDAIKELRNGAASAPAA